MDNLSTPVRDSPPDTPADLSDVKNALIRMRLKQAQKSRSAGARLEPVPRDNALPLSFQQEYLWFVDQITPGLPVYNVPFVLRLRGALDVDALHRSMTALVARHEVLRTRFACSHGVPHQVIDPAPEDVPMPGTDLRGLSSVDRDRRCSELMHDAVSRPFDLAEDRLVRAGLVRLADEEHLFMLTVHHIAVDGWSLGRLAGELAEFYEAFRHDLPARLPELGIQYADFASWQRRYLSGSQLESHLQYWTERLADLPILDFPADSPRPAIRTWSGRTYETTIPPSVYESARALARAERATILGVLFSAFLVVLHRYTGQEDLVVGTVLGGRTQSEVEPLIGYFVNSLVLRTDVTGDPTVHELIVRANDSAVGALGHQDLPFGKLVDAVRAERDPSRNPLFQVSFTLQAGAASIDFRLGDLDVRPVPVPGETARFDIAFQVEEHPDGSAGIWIEYSTELFTTARIERLAAHYITVLTQLVADAGQRISDLTLLTDAERDAVISDRNPRPRPHPTDGLLLNQLVEQHAVRHPARPAVLFGPDTVTYGDLERRANQLAHELREHYGVGTESIVGILLDRGLDLPRAQLGVLKAGGAWLPLDPGNPPARLAFQLRDAGARLLITRGAIGGDLRDDIDIPVVDLGDTVTGQTLDSRPGTAVDSATTADNLAYIIYTSGSTGAPKGVMITHRSAVNFVSTCQQLFGITPDDRLLQFANPAFDVSVFDFYAALGCGASVVGAPRRELLDSAKLTTVLRGQRVTVTDLPPTVLGLLAPEDLPELRILFVGLEPFPGGLVNRWNRDGREFHNGYGPTEATVACIDYRCPPQTLRVTPPIGVAMANHRAYVLDAGQQPVPDGVAGELYVAGAGLARGYQGQPGLTAQLFVPDPFGPPAQRMYRTGDLVRWRDDGNLEFIGRTDGQIKIRGLRIEPGEIEHALRAHPDVSQAAVIVQPAPGGTAPQLAAYVVGPAAATPEAADELREHLAAELPPHMVPARIVGLAALPLTANGKLDRSRLPAPEERESGPTEPSTETQRQVIDVCREVLEIGSGRIGLQDSFFDIGGNSLTMIRLVTRLRDTFDVALDAREILVGPRMQRIAATIDERRAGSTFHDGELPPWMVPIRAEGDRPTLFCVHASGGSAVPYVPLAQQLGGRQPVYGIEAAGLHGEPAAGSVADMASQYLRGVRAVQPSGPYHLAGWSVGGTIALEMAVQLREQGEDVPALILLDCAAPPAMSQPPQHAEMVTSFLHDIAGLRGRPDDQPDTGVFYDLTDHAREDAAIAWLEEAGLIPAGMRDDLRTRMHAFMDTVRAALTFTPRPFDGVLRHGIATEGGSDYQGGWERLGATMVRRAVPGSHYTILQPPHVDRAGAVVREFLAQAHADVEE